MQRNRKMTLNEEFALMRKMFHKMGVTEVLKERRIRLNESVGGPPASAFEVFTPGSSVAIIGRTILPEIENSILMSAKNSDLIMTSLGKKIGDNLTFDDLVNSGVFGVTKKEVAENIVTELGEGGVTLMKQLGDILGGANVTALKNQLAELSSEPQRKIADKLKTIKDQIDIDNPSQKASNLEVISDSLPGLRQTVDNDINLTAAQRTAINQLFDSLEAQANAYKKTAANELTDIELQRINTIMDEIQTGNFSSIRKVLDENPNVVNRLTDSELSTIKNAIDQFTDDEVDAVWKEVGLPLLKGEKPSRSGSGYLTSGGMDPDKIRNTIEGIGIIMDFIFSIPRRFVEQIVPKLEKRQKTFLTFCIWIGLIGWGAYALYGYLSSGKAKEDVIDIVTGDSKDEDCVENLPGYNGLNSDQKKFVITHYGCRETKNNTTNPIASLGTDEDTECLVAVRKDNTSEKWKVTAGGAGEECGGSTPTPNPPNTSCKCTLETMKAELDDGGIVYTDANFDTKTCTGSYKETIEDNGKTEIVNQSYNCIK